MWFLTSPSACLKAPKPPSLDALTSGNSRIHGINARRSFTSLVADTRICSLFQ